jgi:DNA polymerase III delta subunit
MKIIVLHGDDGKKLYARLTKFIETARDRSWEVGYLDDPTLSIQEQLSSSSLFNAERFFIIRDIKRIGKKELRWIAKKSKDLSGNLIIYHEGYIPVSFLKSLPKDVKVEEYKLPVILWTFLDGLYPGNTVKSIDRFHKLIEKEAPEFIFTLIAKLFRDLYWAKKEASTLPYPAWRAAKLRTQSEKFTPEKLKSIIEYLTEIDNKVKTSSSDLTNELDLLIIKQLE